MQYVYILRAGADHYKVGVAKNVAKRVQALQTSNPNLINVVSIRLVADAMAVEASLHGMLSAFRADGGSEWFKLTPLQAVELAEALSRVPHIDVIEQAQLVSEIRKLWVSQETIDAKLDYLIGHMTPPEQHRQQPKAEERDDIPETTPSKPTKDERDAHDAETALAIFQAEGKASTSLLQRRLGIGYGRASRIVDRLEREGHITVLDGNRARVVV